MWLEEGGVVQTKGHRKKGQMWQGEWGQDMADLAFRGHSTPWFGLGEVCTEGKRLSMAL